MVLYGNMLWQDLNYDTSLNSAFQAYDPPFLFKKMGRGVM